MVKLKVAEALEEIKTTSYQDIQRDTAQKWGSRAAAAFDLVSEVSQEEILIYWTLANEFLHESCEHAALVEDGTGDLVQEIQEAVSPHLKRAVRHLEAKLGVSGAEAIDQTAEK